MASMTIPSPIGPLILTSASGSLAGIGFVGAWSAADRPITEVTATDRSAAPSTDPATDAPPDPVLLEAARQLDEYFAGRRTEFDLPLAPQGDSFHLGVWRHIAEIPYGHTASYGSIAAALGGVRLSQAVGSATGGNPLALVVPCHRVVGSDGSLTGFGGGLDRKRFLLALEESDEVRASRLF